MLATWRVTHLVAHEDGPFDVIVALRKAAGPGLWGRLMDCPYCLSLWVAAPLAWWMAGDLAGGLALWLAISGGACLLERAGVAHTASMAEMLPPVQSGHIPACAAADDDRTVVPTAAPHHTATGGVPPAPTSST
jgi:hypothetical protein